MNKDRNVEVDYKAKMLEILKILSLIFLIFFVSLVSVKDASLASYEKRKDGKASSNLLKEPLSINLVTAEPVTLAPRQSTLSQPEDNDMKILSSDSKIELELSRKLSSSGPEDFIRMRIIFKQQVSTDSLISKTTHLDKKEKRNFVIGKLKNFADSTQGNTLKILNSHKTTNKVSKIQPLWILNAVVFEGTKDVVKELSELPEILKIELEEKQEFIKETSWGISKIKADQVWTDLGFSGLGVKVAVIDSGIDYNHTDLSKRMWHNLDEASNNNIDDDGNGYVDDYYGFDFINRDSDPLDDDGHGTLVAGTIAGDGTGGIQTGVAPKSDLMALKVIDSYGGAYNGDILEAIQYSIAEGADIINISLGASLAPEPTRAEFRQASDNAIAAGVTLVVAAGNERNDLAPLEPPYEISTPGDVPSVITVGATDSLDMFTYFSSRGPVTWQDVYPYNDYPYPPGLTKPDVSAPGQDLTSTKMGESYRTWGGTSAAAPHVAGVAALLLEANPSLTPAQIKSILENTAVDLGQIGKDNDYGSGRVDALAAVRSVSNTNHDLSLDDFWFVPDILTPGESYKLHAKITNRGNYVESIPDSVSVSFSGSLNLETSLSKEGIQLLAIINPGQTVEVVYTAGTAPSTPGRYNAAVTLPLVPSETNSANNVRTEQVEVGSSGPSANLYIDPPTTNVNSVDQQFTIDIKVKDVTNLFGYQFDVTFDSQYLEVVNVVEGDFLKSGGSTFFNPGTIPNLINDIYATLLAPATPVNGSGTLAKVTFKVKKMGEAGTTTPIGLTDDLLSDPSANLISHTTTGGEVHLNPKLPGDCNGDERVDISDLVVVGKAFGSRQSDSNWDERADLNNDGRIDISDIVIIGVNFGRRRNL